MTVITSSDRRSTRTKEVHMRRRRKVVVGAVGAVTALALAACGGGNVGIAQAAVGRRQRSAASTPLSSERRTTRPTTRAARCAWRTRGDWDSLDPADTYYALLLELRPALRPHAGDVQARAGQGRRHSWCPTWPSALGKPSDDAKTWTYTLRQGVKFEDGTPVTSQGRQVRASSASLDKDDLPERPDLLQRLPRPAGLHRPLQGHRPEQAGPEGDRDAGRPDDRLPPEASRSAGSTTSRSCRRRSRCPRPRTPARSTRSTWSPPARTCSQTNDLGKSFTLVRNPNWDPATDPNRKALPDQIEVQLERQRRRHRQPAARPVTSTSTSTGTGVQAGRPGARSSPTRT